MQNSNPLLRIDTSFRSYLNAFTRSFKNHVVGDGALDYAFDADFAVRQKINGLSGWSKLSKCITTNDITQEAKNLFSRVSQAGSLKYPEIYDIVKKCSERLELNLPTVFVRNDTDKPMLYSIASEVIEPCIVITEAMLSKYTAKELQLLIGCECGRIQNNHSVYNMACTYLSFTKNGYKPINRSYESAINNQVICALVEWVRYAEITADRAAMICLDSPSEFIDTMAGIYRKGYVDQYGKTEKEINTARILQLADELHMVAARQLKVEDSLNRTESRLLCACEFLNSDALYRWRKDLSYGGIHAAAPQVCDIRCNMILDSTKGVK